MNDSIFLPDASIEIFLENLNDIDFLGRRGSILELYDKDNEPIFGLGFPSVVNTAVRTQGQLVAFVNSNPVDMPWRKHKTIPNPWTERSCGTLLYSALGKIYLTDYYWKQYGVALDKNGDGFGSAKNTYYSRAQIYKGKEIRYWDNKIQYSSKRIEIFPKNISIYVMCVKNDYLFFNIYDEKEKKFSLQVRKIDWKTGEINKKTTSIENYAPNEYVYTYGFLKGKVLFSTNHGNLYSVSVESLNFGEDLIAGEIYKNESGKSFQFYSMLNFYDKVLLGQYPTGNIFIYDGEILEQIKGIPGVPQGYQNIGREVQTLYFSGGGILAGVWPWAELWRINEKLNDSAFLGRLIQAPKNSKSEVHPYEYFVRNYDYNALGQRVTNILGYKNYIYVSTSNKSGKKYAEHDLKEVININDYGSVSVFETKSDFFIPIGDEGVLDKNGMQVIKLEFYCQNEKENYQDKIKIFMNNKYTGEVGSCFSLIKLKGAKITKGAGMFGRYDGKVNGMKLGGLLEKH